MAASDPTILSDMLQPLGSLTPAAAMELARLSIPETVQRRVAVLAEKNNDGTITPEEHEEYATYVRYGNVLAVIKAKAKKVAAEDV